MCIYYLTSNACHVSTKQAEKAGQLLLYGRVNCPPASYLNLNTILKFKVLLTRLKIVFMQLTFIFAQLEISI